MTDWRHRTRTMLKALEAHPADDPGRTPYLIRRLAELDAQAVAGLREEMTPPFPEETAHRYQTAEEVTAAQETYFAAVHEHRAQAADAAKRAERAWQQAVQLTPLTQRRGDDDHASRLQGEISRRLGALPNV